MKQPQNHYRIACIVLVAMIYALFYPVLFQDQNLVYRDGAHFYYPLFSHIQNQLAKGVIPAWNALENCGEPLAASATSSVFYPGKLVFCLPTSYALNYVFYIILHVIIAWKGMHYLCRSQQLSSTASHIASVAYAFSGNVLFQYCNVVFLCSAAWIPWSLAFGLKVFEARKPADSLLLSLTLAMIVLSGDPQGAYLCMMCLGFGILVLWFQRRIASGKARRQRRKDTASHSRSIVPLIWDLTLSFCLAGSLSAVQILPTYEFTRHSTRDQWTAPRNIYDLVSLSQRETGLPSEVSWYDGFIGKPHPSDTHAYEVYQFSLDPWRVLEFIWPNCYGRQFPRDQRWGSCIPGASAVWVPTNYCGLLPFLLAMSAIRFRGGPEQFGFTRKLFSWLVVLFLLASFGSFGLAWYYYAVKGMLGWQSVESAFGPEVGGVYWLFSIVLPGFSSFRFPAKLMIIVAVGLSFLAGVGWDQAIGTECERIRKTLWLTIKLSLIAGFCAVIVLPFWERLFSESQVTYFGRLAVWPAYLDLIASITHAGVSAGICLACFCYYERMRGHRDLSAVVPGVVLVICAVDIWIATYWTVQTLDREVWDKESKISLAIKEHRKSLGENGPFRVFRSRNILPTIPQAGERTNSAALNPQQVTMQFDRGTLAPKFNWIDEISSIDVRSTFEFKEDRDMFATSVGKGADGATQYVRPRRILDAFGTAYFILESGDNSLSPQDSNLGLTKDWLEPKWSVENPQGEPMGEDLLSLRLPNEFTGVRVLHNPSAFPRAWITHNFIVSKPLKTPDEQRAWIQSMSFPYRKWLDLSQWSLVEDDDLPVGVSQTDPVDSDKNEFVRIESYQDTQIILNVKLHRTGLVVLSDRFYPGWTVEVENAGPLPVFRTNRIMRGIFLGPGEHRVIYRFEPMFLQVGAILSLISFGGFGIGFLVLLRKRR